MWLDPPFGDIDLENLCTLLDEDWLARGAHIYIEMRRGDPSPTLPRGWTLVRDKTAGTGTFHVGSQGRRLKQAKRQESKRVSVGAMYPGTFDPVTNGHSELVRRAANLFDRVVVAIAASPAKQPMFSFDERVAMANAVFADVPNVSVDGYDGLTVEYAAGHDLGVIIRGLRAVTDFEYEFQLASMNRHLDNGVETVFLTPTDENAFISSSLVREVALLGGDVSGFVHADVARALQIRYRNQKSN